MKTKWLSKLAIHFLILLLPTALWAAKLDVYFGGYHFEASTQNSSGSVSNLGVYKFGYNLPLFDNFDMGIGYTIIQSEIIGGDSAFGLEIEGFYFPFSKSSTTEIKTSSSYLKVDELWRTFLTAGFHSRQFQSVSTQYTGFGLGGGFERSLDARFNLKALFRYIMFLGPSSGKASELSAMCGLSFKF